MEIRIDSARVAFALSDVDCFIRAVALSPVPGSPSCLLGMVDVHGTVVPVYDTRRLLGLPSRPLRASDRILLTRGREPRGFVADEVTGTLEAGGAQHPAAYSMNVAGVRGVLRRDDGLVLVRDLQDFMALERPVAVLRHA